MTIEIFDSVMMDTEKAVNNFKLAEWKDRGLFERFNELFKMIDGYKVADEQKVYLFRRGVLLLAIEAVHDIFPATDYFRENPEERFLVFRTPGEKKNEDLIDEWVKIEKANWGRQKEKGGELSARGFWWH